MNEWIDCPHCKGEKCERCGWKGRGVAGVADERPRRGGSKMHFVSREALNRAFADYWRNRNRVMRDRLIPAEQRREEIRVRSVLGGG